MPLSKVDVLGLQDGCAFDACVNANSDDSGVEVLEVAIDALIQALGYGIESIFGFHASAFHGNPNASRGERDTRGSNKVGCSTKLPNGKTLGQYINEGRAQMQASVNSGGSFNGGVLTTFSSIAKDYGPIDFKNGAAGTSVLWNRAELGQAGNFAYYAIGSGYISPATLDAGAGAYAVTSALLGKKPFSSLVGPMFSDSSAASVRNAALATPGCP